MVAAISAVNAPIQAAVIEAASAMCQTCSTGGGGGAAAAARDLGVRRRGQLGVDQELSEEEPGAEAAREQVGGLRGEAQACLGGVRALEQGACVDDRALEHADRERRPRLLHRGPALEHRGERLAGLRCRRQRAVGAGAPGDLTSLEDYFVKFVQQHQDQLTETELAEKLGISRKSLWERRQRLNIPRRKTKKRGRRQDSASQ